MSTNFEDRLLGELRRIVADRPAPAGGTPAPVRPRHRRRIALTATGVAAASATAAIVAVGGGTQNAYAVQPKSDGTVTVHINSLRDASGLETSLKAAGVPAEVHYVTGPAPADGSGCGVPPLPVPPSGTPDGKPHTVAGGSVVEAQPVIVGEAGVTTAPEAGKPAKTLPALPARTTSRDSGDDPGPVLQTAGGAPNDPALKSAVTTSVMVEPSGGVQFSVNPAHLIPGQHIVISTRDDSLTSIGMQVVGKDVPDCPTTLTTTEAAPASKR